MPGWRPGAGQHPHGRLLPGAKALAFEDAQYTGVPRGAKSRHAGADSLALAGSSRPSGGRDDRRNARHLRQSGRLPATDEPEAGTGFPAVPDRWARLFG